ncbi:hypothetical protein U6A24_12885 [Aquimarina gracilis]|uniref:Helix-turn-helix domain-containing protein n=1 Tax=Aquimarina gracilis TaxID=874422 RepID=A0ABU5ZWY9_9FLAO|nr:hypothetical protein [Aquimarina gracilis]MEB3346365.1 hypothetical protein [Aquimarina gracilis]
MNTFEDYKKGILNKCLDIKNDTSNELFWHFENLTPGQIRSASRDVFYKRNENNDLQILSIFFGIPRQRDFYSYLNTINAEFFLTTKNFIEGVTKNPDKRIVEYAAWLVDFKPRPYSQFRKKDLENGQPEEETIEKLSAGIPPPDLLPIWKKARIAITISITITSITLLYFSINWQQKDCMTWKKDHYELASCPKSNNPNIIPIDEKLLKEFRKIEVDTNFTFFNNNGEVLVWYYKADGTIEFFNSGGRHPINNKVLRPVTQTIVRKYVFGEE